MSKIYVAIFILSILTSCSPSISYVGQRSEPTRQVDVFISETSVEKPYKVIGKGFQGISFAFNMEKVQNAVVKKGKKVGADAVLFLEYNEVGSGTSINTVQQTDSLGKGILTTANTTIQPISNRGFNIFYIKYR